MFVFERITPVDLLARQVGVLRCHLPAVFDGDTAGVHDARIATRRLRAVLPLVEALSPALARDDDFGERIKQISRALGSIRDLDARLDLLTYVEARLPGAGSALVAARHRQREKRASRSRKLVKRLEALDIERELERVARACRSAPWRNASGAWRAHLRQSIETRADAALVALAGGSAVYFPNRTHKTRIAVKKLRYAAEIAAATELAVPEASMRRLRKAQDALGALHDRHVLLDELNDTTRPNDRDASPQLATIVQFIEAEMTDQYRRFVERREPLIAAVRNIHDVFDGSRAVAVAWAAVAAAAVVTGVRALGRRAPAETVRVAPFERHLASAVARDDEVPVPVARHVVVR
jgi:CHAD domain-containing protein